MLSVAEESGLGLYESVAIVIVAVNVLHVVVRLWRWRRDKRLWKSQVEGIERMNRHRHGG